MHPLYNVMMSHIRGDQEQFKLTTDDMLRVFTSPAASTNAAVRLYKALNFGQWLSKTGTVIENNVGPTQAWLQTLTGLVDQRTANVSMDTEAKKTQREAMQMAEKEYTRYMHLAIENHKLGNEQASDENLQNAKATLELYKYPIQQRHLLWQKVMDENTDLIHSLRWDRWMRKSTLPAGEEKQRQEIFNRMQQSEQGQR